LQRIRHPTTRRLAPLRATILRSRFQIRLDRNVPEVLGSWNQNVASWMGLTGRPVHVMRYEDMLRQPERTFGALARFLRLAPSEEQLKRAIAKSSFEM
jgi:hypothetical protein